MCKELTQQAWDCLSLERPVFKFGPWPVSGNLDFRRVLTALNGKSSTLCLNQVPWVQFMLSFDFPFGSLESGYVSGRGCFPDQCSVQTCPVQTWALSLNELPWMVTFHTHHHLLYVLRDSTGRRLLGTHAQTLPHVYFFFADFAVSFHCNKS